MGLPAIEYLGWAATGVFVSSYWTPTFHWWTKGVLRLWSMARNSKVSAMLPRKGCPVAGSTVKVCRKGRSLTKSATLLKEKAPAEAGPMERPLKMRRASPPSRSV